LRFWEEGQGEEGGVRYPVEVEAVKGVLGGWGKIGIGDERWWRGRWRGYAWDGG